MKTTAPSHASPRSPGGYSLVEVLIAAGILLIGISAAATMINALTVQENADTKICQALNTQEQAAALWQLGLSPDTITNILPARCVSSNPPGPDAICLVFTTNTTNVAGPGNMEGLSPLRAVYLSQAAPDGTLAYRTNDVIAVRPTNR